MQIVKSSGRDGDATLAGIGMQGDVRHPAMRVHPTGTVDHQRANVGITIAFLQPLQSEAALIHPSVLLRDQELP